MPMRLRQERGRAQWGDGFKPKPARTGCGPKPPCADSAIPAATCAPLRCGSASRAPASRAPAGCAAATADVDAGTDIAS
jgi:hypothetical protein